MWTHTGSPQLPPQQTSPVWHLGTPRAVVPASPPAPSLKPQGACQRVLLQTNLVIPLLRVACSFSSE